MKFFDPEKIKLDFNIFKNNPDLIYLDNGATSQKPILVTENIKKFYENFNSNVHRSISEFSENSTILYEQARQKVANFINAQYEEIIFTSGTTEGINFVANTWGKKFINSGDKIVLTQVEHHANFLPWYQLAKEKGASLEFIKLNTKTFELDINLDKIFDKKTKLLAISHNSNVLGDVWPEGVLEKLISKAHEMDIKVLLDSAQYAPHYKIDIKKLNPDFLVFSGHKMLGPTGVGVLYINKSLHEVIPPYKLGGSMVYSVSFDKEPEYRSSPYKFEAGTPPIAQAIGLGYAIDYLNNLDLNLLKSHEINLTKILIEELGNIKSCTVIGNIDNLKNMGHLVTFNIKNIHAHDIGAYLSKKNICVRTGHHCVQPLFNLLNIESSIRVSFYLYNTKQEIEIFIKELHNAIKFLT